MTIIEQAKKHNKVFFMKSKTFLQLIIYCFSILWSFSVAAMSPQEQEIKNWAQSRGNELLAALKENDLPKKYKMLDDLYGQYVDSNYIARFVMGKYWRRMTDSEQQTFQALFHRYALALYKTYPLDFGNSISFNITNVRDENGRISVYAQIHQQNVSQENILQDILVEFNIRREGSALLLTDIKIAESSLSIAYRNKFYQMMMEDDEEITWFLEDFEVLVRSIETKNEQKLKLYQDAGNYM